MKSFTVPLHYRSSLISAIKRERQAGDKLKRDFTPITLCIGTLEVILARHFGFCYGVENAIEIAFRAIEENPGKRIFLLSEMIHNPGVNADLIALGVQFIMDTRGNMLLDWNDLNSDDVVIVPAFGTTLELEQELRNKGINPAHYETTCPFVEKVWNRAEKIATEGFSIIVHGKPGHEETRATFSHSTAHTPTIVIKDMEQAVMLGKFITASLPASEFYSYFDSQYSKGFDVTTDLKRIGVVNQTTMLASETQAISDYLKNVILLHNNLSSVNLNEHFADTRDTLCYATNDNQSAVKGMLEQNADIALVIGGYNSSNTSHLVELCELKLPTYFINDEHCLLSHQEIRHYDLHQHIQRLSTGYLTASDSVNTIKIMVTSGASCPDALVERVIERLAQLTGNEILYSLLVDEWNKKATASHS